MRFISILIPGGTYVCAWRPWLGFLVPLMSIIWVALFSASRWIIDPYFFLAMTSGLLAFHLLSYLHGLRLIKAKQLLDRPGAKIALFAVALIILNTFLAIYCHKNKSTIFGFELYHVPSPSMSPTINVGDIILVDTWFPSDALESNQIIVFKRSDKGLVLLKRLNELKERDGKLELYVTGDNKARSKDSRSFGWVDANYFIGVATGALFTLRDNERNGRKYPKRL